MSSAKRKKKAPAKYSSKSVASTNDAELNLGVCVPCKQAKIRCRFVPNAIICKRCQSKGFTTECVIEPPKSRSRSNGQGSSTSAPAAQRKRGNSESSGSQAARPSKHPRLASHSHRTRLDSIMEVNDEDESLADTLVSENISVLPVHDHKVPRMSKAQFMDAVIDGHEDEENEGSELEDPVDVEISSSSDSEGSSKDSDNEDHSTNMYSLKSITRKPQSTAKPTKAQSSKGSMKPLANSKCAADTYDPATCPFDISSVVCRSDGANAPITISSKTTLDKLRIAVAEKLDRFPGLVALQYRLSSDNAKAGAISIQTNEELKLFKDRMRKLIVPPRLANGKASNRIPKAVLVYFEDASGEVKETSTNSKKNTSAASRQKPPSVSSGQAEFQIRKMQILTELQSKWRCPKHSKDQDIYCYSTDGNVCLTLTHGNLSFWALDIMEGNGATIEEKPVTLYLHSARPASRATTPRPPDQMGFMGPIMPPGMYGYPPGPVAMPMWGYGSGLPGGPGQFYGMQPPMMNTMPTADRISSSNAAPVAIPDIAAWFSYLDQHEERNKDGIIFTPYGVTLKSKGFLRISQLTPEFIQLKDLQEWLGIEVGTAILIMQYAKEDLDALKSRKWAFPNNQ